MKNFVQMVKLKVTGSSDSKPLLPDINNNVVWLQKDVRLEPAKNSKGSRITWLCRSTWRMTPYTVLSISIPVYLVALQLADNGLTPFFNYLGSLACFHTYVLGVITYSSIFTAPLSLIIGLLGILTIQPVIFHELRRRVPRGIGIRAEGLVLLNANSGVLVPWSSVVRVKQVPLLLQGCKPISAIAIELEHQPKVVTKAERAAWSLASGLRNAVLYLDSSGRLPDDSEYMCLWIPLEMLASEVERERFISAIRNNLDANKIDESVPRANALGAASFTTMWLDQLKESDRSGALSPGHKLRDRYEVKNQLGAGGFSTVYQAIDRSAANEDNHEVAIKEFTLNIPGSSAPLERRIASVMSEVDLLKTLDHPSIVKVLDYFAESGRMYVVLEAIRGPNLRKYASENSALSEERLIEIALQCCEILSYLHEHEPPVFHRDLAPDNFIMSNAGVRLIDFNIAIVGLQSESTLIVGKHCYMAPEQFIGTTNHSTDLYQLGASLFYIATGGVEPEPLSIARVIEHRSDLSAGFCAIIEQLTQQKADRRFASIHEVADRFRMLLIDAREHQAIADVQ